MKTKRQKKSELRPSGADPKPMTPLILGELLLLEYSLQESIRSFQNHANEVARRLERINDFLKECRTKLYPPTP